MLSQIFDLATKILLTSAYVIEAENQEVMGN